MTRVGSQPNGAVREGDVLAGKYRIEKILGKGGMGMVVAAYHTQLDEKVAIKFLLPEWLGNSEVVMRFLREARAAVKIKSEHVARVIDVGELDNGAPYMVMEFLEGGDLSAWLEQKGVLSIEQAVEFVLHASEAIAEAHSYGIVHRDLKPANIFCTRRPDGMLSAKVLDFGISKIMSEPSGSSSGSMTRTSAVMGSCHYMSPEQIKSPRDVDARADIWALGVVLFVLLTGKTPFEGEEFYQVCMNVVNASPLSIRAYRPDAPIELEQVINKCLAKDRNDRFTNAAELGVALLPFAPKRARSSVERILGVIQSAGLSASALALPPSSDALSSAVQTDVTWGQTAPPATSSNKWIALGVFVVLTALGIASLSYTKSKVHSRDGQTASATLSVSSRVATVAHSDVVTVTTSAVSSVLAVQSAVPIASAPAREAKATTTSRSTAPISAALRAPHAAAPSGDKPDQRTARRSTTNTEERAKAKLNCDPPYWRDAKGHKHFIPECVQ